MNHRKRGVTFALTCAVFVLASTLGSPAQYTREAGVMFLDQGWSDDDRLSYYYTSQGSELEQSLAIDPDYAPACARLSLTHFYAYWEPYDGDYLDLTIRPRQTPKS
jgi:hypothetical protein